MVVDLFYYKWWPMRSRDEQTGPPEDRYAMLGHWAGKKEVWTASTTRGWRRET